MANFNVANGAWENAANWSSSGGASLPPTNGTVAVRFSLSGGSRVTLSGDYGAATGTGIRIDTATTLTGLSTRRTLTVSSGASEVRATTTLDNLKLLKSGGTTALTAGFVLQNGGVLEVGGTGGITLNTSSPLSITSGSGSGNAFNVLTSGTADVTGGSSSFSITAGVAFGAAGTLNLLSGTLTTASTSASLSGTVAFGASSASTFLNTGDLSVGSLSVGGGASNGGSDDFQNSGTLTVGGVGAASFNAPSAGGYTLSNSGTFNIVSGFAVLFAQPFRQTAGTLNLNSPSLSLASSLTCDGGTVVGSATIAGSGSAVFNSSSSLSPGSPGLAGSVGSISFPAALTLHSGASLAIDVASTASSDRVQVAGAATITGSTLTVTRSGPVTSGTVFDILSAGSLVGTFNGLQEGATVNAADSQVRFTVNYGTVHPNTVTLTAAAVPEPASHASILGLGLLCLGGARLASKRPAIRGGRMVRPRDSR